MLAQGGIPEASMAQTNTPISENVNIMNQANNQEIIKQNTTQDSNIEIMTPEIESKLKAGQLDEAVELLGKVLELSIVKYGGDDLNPLLAETYARYGSLLLRLAIQNNDQNVLSSGNAATAGTPETTDALLQAASGNKKRLIEFNGDYDEDDEEDDQEDADSNELESPGAEEENCEDEDDFTIAWENLDVARLLFLRRIEASNEESEKLALNRALGFVYQDLGDLSLENENFTDAIEEYELAIKCFGSATIETLRDLAGIYFNLALSMEFVDKLSESKAMYLRAKSLLQQKEAHLLATNEDSFDEKSNAYESVSNSELNELKGLISEISLKIEDMDNNNQSSMAQDLINATNKAALSAAQNLNGAVNDLSGMIKKRKAEPVQESSEKASKAEKQNDIEKDGN